MSDVRRAGEGRARSPKRVRRIMPTALGAFYFGMAVLLALQALREPVATAGEALLLISSVVVGAMLAGAVVGALNVFRVGVRRRPVSHGVVGVPIVVVDEVEVARPVLPALGLSATIEEGETESKAVRLPAVGPRRVALVAHRVACLRRGLLRIGDTVVRSGWPFGLIQFARRHQTATSVVVYPGAARVATDWLHQLARGGEGMRANRVGEMAQDLFCGLRDRRDSDPISRIHWASSARLARLVVREFEAVQERRVFIALDVAEARAEFEQLVSIAAGGIEAALARRIPAGLLLGGGEPVALPPSLGAAHWHRCMTELALIRARAVALSEWLPGAMRLVGRHVTVVIVSSRPQAELERVLATLDAKVVWLTPQVALHAGALEGALELLEARSARETARASTGGAS